MATISKAKTKASASTPSNTTTAPGEHKKLFRDIRS
jgi:hypothetical protein